MVEYSGFCIPSPKYYKSHRLVRSQSTTKPWGSLLLTGNLSLVSFQICTNSYSTLKRCVEWSNKRKDTPKHPFKLLSVRKLWWRLVGIRHANCKTESSRHVGMPLDFPTDGHEYRLQILVKWRQFPQAFTICLFRTRYQTRSFASRPTF